MWQIDSPWSVVIWPVSHSHPAHPSPTRTSAHTRRSNLPRYRHPRHLFWYHMFALPREQYLLWAPTTPWWLHQEFHWPGLSVSRIVWLYFLPRGWVYEESSASGWLLQESRRGDSQAPRSWYHYWTHCRKWRWVSKGTSESLVLLSPIQISETHTLWLIPKSSSILANAAARLNPECDRATSTTSSSIPTGIPSTSKWTETATYALRLGDVHASVVKLRSPSCSCQGLSRFTLLYQRVSDLKHISDALPNTHKHILNITRNSFGRRYVIIRASCFH